jgi:hypothetical protein
MPNNLFFLVIQIIFLSHLLLLYFNTYVLSILFISLHHFFILSLLCISPHPFYFLNLLTNLFKLHLSWSKFLNFSCWSCLVNDIVNLSPSICLLFINQYKCLSFSIGSSCSPCPMNVCITIYWHSNLNNIAYIEI